MASATPTNEGTPVNNTTTWGIIAVIVVVLVLAYALGWFGGGDVTAPPAAGTGTVR